MKLKNFEDIDAIIFDFGGVFINIDYQKTTEQLSALLQEPAAFTQDHQGALFDAIETGEITPAEFRDRLRQHCRNPRLSDQQLDAAWNALLGDIPGHRVQLLRDLRPHFKKMLLLSNTNAIHLAAIQATMTKAAGSPAAFENLFDQVYYSHLMQLRKPHPEIFQRVVREQSIDPARCLFIDDSLQHVLGARRVGLRAHHLTGEVAELFRAS